MESNTNVLQRQTTTTKACCVRARALFLLCFFFFFFSIDCLSVRSLARLLIVLASSSQSSSVGWGEGSDKSELGQVQQTHIHTADISRKRESKALIRDDHRLQPCQRRRAMAGGLGLELGLLLHAAACRISGRDQLLEPERPASAERYATRRARYVLMHAWLWLALWSWDYARGLYMCKWKRKKRLATRIAYIYHLFSYPPPETCKFMVDAIEHHSRLLNKSDKSVYVCVRERYIYTKGSGWGLSGIFDFYNWQSLATTRLARHPVDENLVDLNH